MLTAFCCWRGWSKNLTQSILGEQKYIIQFRISKAVLDKPRHTRPLLLNENHAGCQRIRRQRKRDGRKSPSRRNGGKGEGIC